MRRCATDGSIAMAAELEIEERLQAARQPLCRCRSPRRHLRQGALSLDSCTVVVRGISVAQTRAQAYLRRSALVAHRERCSVCGSSDRPDSLLLYAGSDRSSQSFCWKKTTGPDRTGRLGQNLHGPRIAAEEVQQAESSCPRGKSRANGLIVRIQQAAPGKATSNKQWRRRAHSW